MDVATLPPWVREHDHAALTAFVHGPQIGGGRRERCAAPCVEEERAKLVCDVAANADHVVAPAVAAFFGGEPLPAQVDAAGETNEAVDDEQLAMVAALE